MVKEESKEFPKEGIKGPWINFRLPFFDLIIGSAWPELNVIKGYAINNRLSVQKYEELSQLVHLCKKQITALQF